MISIFILIIKIILFILFKFHGKKIVSSPSITLVSHLRIWMICNKFWYVMCFMLVTHDIVSFDTFNVIWHFFFICHNCFIQISLWQIMNFHWSLITFQFKICHLLTCNNKWVGKTYLFISCPFKNLFTHNLSTQRIETFEHFFKNYFFNLL